MRERLFLFASTALSLAACGSDPPAPMSWPAGSVVVHANTADPALTDAVDDLVADLGRVANVTAQRSTSADPAGCVAGQTHVFFAAPTAMAHPDAYAITEERCGDGHRVTLRGAGPVQLSWAAYDLMDRLGVRYFHPEQTYYPRALRWPAEPIRVEAAPSFQLRSIHVHRTHPVELRAPLDTTGVDMAAHQRRWIDWNVKMRLNDLDGWDAQYVGDRAYRRGFPRGGGFTLLGAQQGQMGLLNPDDPRPENEQIAAGIDAALAPQEGAPSATRLDFQFNASEFTEADDQETVRRLTFISNYVAEHHPDVSLWTINHGTASEPTPHYGVRYFDLPQFAPANLGVKVHTLMFYDLVRPANVYGNADFSGLLRWVRQEAPRRRIIHYPEASWWLTFDLPVPLYLAPATIEARQYDVELLRPLLSTSPSATTGVYGHHIFSSGQEWGYWLIDWCFARMSWDATTTAERCVADFTSIFTRGDEVATVLAEVERRQVQDMRFTEVVRYLVGSDDATETAARAGIVFHPLPPAPSEVVTMDEASADLVSSAVAGMRVMSEDYARWTARLDAVLPMQDERQAPWLREVRDGLKIFGLRAAHAAAVYEGALLARSAVRNGVTADLARARTELTRAAAITEQARAVVRAREMDYRYPAALSTAGDEVGTAGAIPNGTVYPYRVLSRVHRLFYWTRPDEQLRALLDRGVDPVRVERRMILTGASLAPSLLVGGATNVSIDWGDGQSSTGLASHTYASQGLFDWRLQATHDGAALDWRDQVAVVARRWLFRKGSLRITQPMGASLLNGTLPGFEVGTGTDATGDFMALGRVDNDGGVSARGSLTRRARSGMSSGPQDLDLDVSGVGALTVFGSTITLDTAGDRPIMAIAGELSTQRVIELLISVGGFDEQGARRLVASILGFTPMTLPERVSFRVEAPGDERP